MFIRTDDPISDAVEYFDDRERSLKHLPICAYCGERMECDHLYDFGGRLICEACIDEYLDDNYKHRVDEYVDDRYL
jgi:hypothetical protein